MRHRRCTSDSANSTPAGGSGSGAVGGQGRRSVHSFTARRAWALFVVVALWLIAAQVSHLQARRRVSPVPVAGQVAWAGCAFALWPSRRHAEYLALAGRARGEERVTGWALLRLCQSRYRLTELGYYAAAAYAREHCPVQAVGAATRGTGNYPSSALLQYSLGRALLGEQRSAEAALALEQAFLATQQKRVPAGLRRSVVWWRYRALLSCRSFRGAYGAALDGARGFPGDVRFLQGAAVSAEALGEPAAAADLWLGLAAREGNTGRRALYDVCRLYGRLRRVREGKLLLATAAPRASASWRHACMAALVAPSAPRQAQKELQEVDEAELSALGAAQAQLLKTVAPLWTQPQPRPKLILRGRVSPDTTVYWYGWVYALQSQAECGDRNARGWLAHYEAELRKRGNVAYYLDLRDIREGRQLRMPRFLGLCPHEGNLTGEPADTMATRQGTAGVT